MDKLELTNYLYHGIIDWLNYDKTNLDYETCFKKLENILKTRFIIRPCDFNKFGIIHRDFSNPYSYYNTFLAIHPNSIYHEIFKKEEKENGYEIATTLAPFGFILSPSIIDELPIINKPFIDCEIIIDDNISLDKYLLGLYINQDLITISNLHKLINLLKLYNYQERIIDIKTGIVLTNSNEEYKLTK